MLVTGFVVQGHICDLHIQRMFHYKNLVVYILQRHANCTLTLTYAYKMKCTWGLRTLQN